MLSEDKVNAPLFVDPATPALDAKVILPLSARDDDPLDIEMSPPFPDEPLPELMVTAPPSTDPDPDAKDTAPPFVSALAPDDNVMEPPFPDAFEAPLLTLTDPPSPEPLAPPSIATEPPAAVDELPLLIEMLPLLLSLDPTFTLKDPA